MIEVLISYFKKGVHYVRNHPQLLFVLILLIVVPVLFLYTGNQFLEVGRQNQDRLQKDRIGLLQDTFATLVSVVGPDTNTLSQQITQLTDLNPDLVELAILKRTTNGYTFVAPTYDDNKHDLNEDFLNRTSFVNDESLIFEYYEESGRVWEAVRTFTTSSGETYVVYTKLSLALVDDLFTAREQTATWSLAFIYVIFLVLAYWHVRQTDYRVLYQKSRKANETKDIFTNMIAHELRAPLTAIKGYANFAKEEAVSDEQVKHISRIIVSSDRLLELINDLLDVARIQSGRLKFKIEEQPVGQTLHAACAELQIKADEKHIALKVVEEEPVVAKFDQKRLHQVIINILSNSIKYTKEGTITVRLQVVKGYAEVRIEDTGMGIAAADQKQLFAPFFRVDSSDVSNITGTGLGMWITRQLIELMQGTITVESIKGVGTHVIIHLPLAD